VVPMMVSRRCAITASAARAQNLLRERAGFRRGHNSLGPVALSRAGTRVSDVATLKSGMSSPPRPMLRRNGSGTSTRAAKETATVTPLKRTDRPAVLIAARTAASLSRPVASSSRQRVTISSE
jgi:hypothetical protein